MVEEMSDVERAFRAGWNVNADATHHSAAYLKGCEDADWKAYEAGKMDLIACDPEPLPPLMLFPDETRKLFGDVQRLLGTNVRLTTLTTGMRSINSIEGGGQQVVLVASPHLVACTLEDLPQCILTEIRGHDGWNAEAAGMDWALVVGIHEVVQWTREGWSIGLAVAVDKSRKERLHAKDRGEEGGTRDQEVGAAPAQDDQVRGDEQPAARDHEDDRAGAAEPDTGASGSDGGSGD